MAQTDMWVGLCGLSLSPPQDPEAIRHQVPTPSESPLLLSVFLEQVGQTEGMAKLVAEDANLDHRFRVAG